jgi:hypothetical protein
LIYQNKINIYHIIATTNAIYMTPDSRLELAMIVEEIYKMVKNGHFISNGNGLQLDFPEYSSMGSFYGSPLYNRIQAYRNSLNPNRVDKINSFFLEDRIDELQREVDQLKQLITLHLPQATLPEPTPLQNNV